MNLIKKINKLPKEILNLVRLCADLARNRGYRAFLVGGFVRDLILNVENFDVDVVIEGNGIDFAQNLSQRLKAKLIRHPRFGTATLITPDKFKIDIATARREYYQQPATLPQVEFSSLKDDLRRRDFTINALAIEINKDNFGQLIDFFQGQKDIAKKKIRVLHESSFIDDPTRVLRAIRFEQRYSFKIELKTLKLLKEATNLKMLEETEEQRLRDELILMLKEAQPIKCLKRLNSLCGLSFIHSKLHFNRKTENLLFSAQKNIHWFRTNLLKRRSLDTWLIYFICLLDNLSIEGIKNICQRFAFHKGDSLRIISYKKYNLEIMNSLDKKNVNPSALYRLLEPLPYEIIIVILAKSKNKRIEKRIKDFLLKYNGIRISVSGKDLANLNLAPGPRFKKILNRVLYAKINGKIHTKQEELEFLKKQIK